MTGTRCSPACSTALEPLPVWGLKDRSHQRSARLLPPGPAPQASPPLALQLLLKRGEEAPVGPLRNNLLRRRLDHAGLVQAQRVETQRVFGIQFSPLVVGERREALQRPVPPRREAPLHQQPRRSLRRLRA